MLDFMNREKIQLITVISNILSEETAVSERIEGDSEEWKAADTARILNALANTYRLKMLETLCHREVSVTTLASATGLSQSATSQHLSKLYQVDLVARRRESQTIYYKIASETVRQWVLKILAPAPVPARQ
jgi:DNA-binding transcriptional ArsR family regulator